jgi:hypothetical protein
MCQTAQSLIIPKAKTSTTRHCYSIAISPEFRRYYIVIPVALSDPTVPAYLSHKPANCSHML